MVGVSRLYDEIDLRSSYVIWQEGVDPFVVVELLSPGTEKEDLGEYAEPVAGGDSLSVNPEPGSIIDTDIEVGNSQKTKQISPRKWEVYEQILPVPYYVVRRKNT